MTFPPFTTTEDQQIDVVRAHQLATKPATEMLVCMSECGTRIIDTDVGTAHTAHLTPTMLKHLSDGGQCKLIHNHPSEGSLSTADWRLCIAHLGIIEIIAVSSQRSTYRAAVLYPSGLDRLLKSSNYPQAEYEVNKRLCQPGVLPVTNWDILLALEPSVSDLLNERLASLMLIKYEAVHAGTDAALRQRTDTVSLLVAGRTAASQYLS